MFADFIDDKDVDLIGVEAGGLGVETGKHASAMALGEPGVLHGMKWKYKACTFYISRS